MKIVVLGDVSGAGQYHLGDEAMTEVAIEQLRRRGAEVTLIAGEVDISGPFYDVTAVPRFGFWRPESRRGKQDLLDRILAEVRNGSPSTAELAATVGAVREARAVVIAGGGNLNSRNTPNHIFDRLALKRIAEHFEVPLYVSSQTVGPELAWADRVMIAEIMSYARVVGARESYTAELIAEITGGRARVVRTLDDAVLLEPSEDAMELSARLGLPDRYAVGSFTYHAWSTGLPRYQLYREIARALDEVCERRDLDIVLLPHMGVLGESEQRGDRNDVYCHDAIVAASRSGRIRSLPMISAREVLAVTADAEFSISTRYHPLVFGAALGVPAIGLVTSFYSSVRMRGALDNFGLSAFAIPFESWRSVFAARVLDALSRDAPVLRRHATRVSEFVREYQSSWWDGVVADISGHGELMTSDAVFSGGYSWAASEADADLLLTHRLAHDATNIDRLNVDFSVEQLREQLVESEKRIDELERELHALRDETQREAAQLRHRTRPPGAALRDRINAWRRSRLGSGK
ncbi:polysaccharide pyruvyl transferase family protein [Leucobacter massiliensis]|uniref:polysaccharide pyruvyl transferase family protein n=1 Tax=Leucobacter massiliensis TaxID=1686285 RepID=UPI0015E414E3|nr:polysaccharide pyruvyl transferase family protein [Leucobacter massiliensis]